ncbi:MAG: PorT family protein [Bacteroidales bacterium]|nr:PorT family protein [Bacteroidales bacterium]
MKKLIAVVAAALICTGAFAKVGLIGGVSFSPQNVSFKDLQQWHAGLTWEIPLVIGFSLQPSLLYATKAGIAGNEMSAESLKMGYVQLPVQLLWGPDIANGNFKPYIFAEPYVGYNLTQNGQWVDVKNIKDAGKLFDWGGGLGVGVKLFKHLQVTGKYVWSFGSIVAADGAVNEEYKNFDIKSPGAITISAAILF